MDNCQPYHAGFSRTALRIEDIVSFRTFPPRQVRKSDKPMHYNNRMPEHHCTNLHPGIEPEVSPDSTQIAVIHNISLVFQKTQDKYIEKHPVGTDSRSFSITQHGSSQRIFCSFVRGFHNTSCAAFIEIANEPSSSNV